MESFPENVGGEDSTRGYLILKRLLDIVGSLLALALFFPFGLIIAVLIRLDSPGPAIFKQRRAGQHGRPFTMYKFRTMVSDAEQQLSKVVDVEHLKEPVFKLKSDPRVTRLGRFLRKTSLDEVPQFVNVLLGDMSIVGPRPEEVWLVEKYDAVQRQRLGAKPGITGPMQVSGRGDLTLSERVVLDVDYIRNQSFLLDLKIIVLTIPAVLIRRGAR